MLVSESRTEDGVEACFAIIYLGHFLLTRLLLDSLVHSGKDGSCSRVISICTAFSSSHEAYAWSKLAQLLFTSHLHCAPEPSGSAVTVDPGLVDTGLYGRLARLAHRPVARLFFKTPAEGAAAAVSPELEGVGGCVVSEGHQIQSSAASLHQDLQAGLWRKTCDLLCLRDSLFLSYDTQCGRFTFVNWFN